MREILFRGKRVSNGEWVIGGIMKTFHPNYDSQNEKDFFAQKPNCYCICANNKDYFVDQSSIGQFTGLTDKNGTKIFEGDIIKHYNDRTKPNKYEIYQIIFDERSYMFKGKLHENYSAQLRQDLSVYYENIGNIHDNPELLGGDD